MKAIELELPRAYPPHDIDAGDWPQRGRASPHLAVVAIAFFSVFPALSWCGLIWLVGTVIGFPPGVSTLVVVGAVISLFLTVMMSVILANH